MSTNNSMILHGWLKNKEQFLARPCQPGSNSKEATGKPQPLLEKCNTWAEIQGESFIDFVNRNCMGKIFKVWQWKIKDIRILAPHEIPDITSLDWQLERHIWGTFGKNGDQPLKYVLLKDATTEHLEAILDTQKQISIPTKEIIQQILQCRYRKGLPQKNLELLEI